MRKRLPVSTLEARRARGLVKDEKMSAVAQAKRAGKYNAKGCWLDSRTGEPSARKQAGAVFFASQAEAERFRQLLTLKAAGLIDQLRLQRVFNLSHGGVHLCTYRADFDYVVLCPDTGRMLRNVTEDVKGMILDVYELKKRMVLAFTGVAITEIPAKDIPKWHNKIPPPPKG